MVLLNAFAANFTGACGLAAHQSKDYILIGEPFSAKCDLAFSASEAKTARAGSFSDPGIARGGKIRGGVGAWGQKTRARVRPAGPPRGGGGGPAISLSLAPHFERGFPSRGKRRPFYRHKTPQNRYTYCAREEPLMTVRLLWFFF
jgi:hypothetical protein